MEKHIWFKHFLRALQRPAWVLAVFLTGVSLVVFVFLPRYRYLFPALGVTVVFAVLAVVISLCGEDVKRKKKLLLTTILVVGFSVVAVQRHIGGLGRAIAEGEVARVKRLIAKGADTNKMEYGNTLLSEAVRYRPLRDIIGKGNDPYGHKKICEMVRILLDNSANPNILNVRGTNPDAPHSGIGPLHYAIKQQIGTEVATLLLDYGANPNLKTANGQTPLHLAVQNAREEFIPMLVEYGADVNAKNKEGKTPLALAVEQDTTGIANLLRQNGATE